MFEGRILQPERLTHHQNVRFESLRGCDAKPAVFEQLDGPRIAGDQVDHVLEDGLHDRVQFERGGGDAHQFEHGFFALALFPLRVEQDRVLDRNGGGMSKGLHQRCIAFGKEVDTVAVEVDEPDDLVLCDHGDAHPAADLFGASPFFEAGVRLSVRHDKRLARLD